LPEADDLSNMPIIQWRCAHGEAPAITLDADGPVVPLAPADDSVDSNLVRIQGSGTIEWLGAGFWITKRVIFVPGITLHHNPPHLDLLTDADRHITSLSIGTYSCDGEGNWLEVHFTSTGAEEVSRRLDAIEQRLEDIERMLKR
jgi:hypothetical protein